MPAPAQAPLIAAIVILGISRSICDVSMKLRRTLILASAGPLPSGLTDRRSPPELKPRPAPVRITTRTVSSLLAAIRPARTAVCSGAFIAFSVSGRFIVIVAMPPPAS